MIETIYSNESGEAGRTSKVQNSFKMPKNIRQVGKSNSIKKIYVEDYVMTFIKQLAGGEYSGCKIAVLVGQSIRLDNCRNIFVSGAVEVKDVDTSGDLTFSNDTWTSIYEDIKKYFVEAEIVGWFLGGPGYLLEDEDKILKLHIDNFAGQDKVLLTFDNMEKEEAFFSYESGRLSKQDGYYIYYEKNEEMQSYMIEHKGEQSFEAEYDDKISRDIRTVLQNKKLPDEDNKSITRLMYAAGTLLAVIILVVAATMLNNYDQMSKMQDKIDGLYQNMVEIQTLFEGGEEVSETSAEVGDSLVDTETDTSDDQSLDVEVVPGDVEPVEEASDPSDSEKVEDKDAEDKDNKEENSSDEELAEDTTDTSDTSEPEKADSQTTSAQNEVKYYTVQTGDTLADISFKLYNTYTKVDKIMKMNGIEDQDLIYVGQKLIVP